MQFSRLLRKIVEVVKILIKPQVGTIIHGNTSSEALTTFFTTNDAIWAGNFVKCWLILV